MYPKPHIILGAVCSVLLYFIFHLTIIQSLVVFLASFLIDVDHYIFYVNKKKDFSLKNAYKWFHEYSKSKNQKPMIVFFHTIEFLIIISVLSFYLHIFLFILIGMLFHSILDIIDLGYHRVIHLREFSFIIWLFSDKRKYC